jgi:peroxiredoxin Q/BCP
VGAHFGILKAKTNEEVAGGEGETAGAEAGEAEKLASIDVGDSLPSLTLKDEKNEDIQIADLASEGGVVLFLVPKADTRKHFVAKLITKITL